MSDSITVRVKPETRGALDSMAATMERDRDELIAEALDNYIELREWQLKEIDESIAQADRGDFVPEDEMTALLNRLSGPR